MNKRLKNCNEKFLYHGSAETAIDNICKLGFNRSYCGVNGIYFQPFLNLRVSNFKFTKKGVALGHGVYFAANSNYSNNYAKPSANGYKRMLRARVLVGESCLGNSTMRVPPNKPNGEPFDSTTDGSNTVFVCYHDCQCYPDYLIIYS